MAIFNFFMAPEMLRVMSVAAIKERHGEGHPLAMKIAKMVAIAAVTTIISAALSPAAGIVLQNIQAGGGLGGNVLGEAASAAAEGLKSVADPLKLAKKAVTKTITKGMPLGND